MWAAFNPADQVDFLFKTWCNWSKIHLVLKTSERVDVMVISNVYFWSVQSVKMGFLEILKK